MLFVCLLPVLKCSFASSSQRHKKLLFSHVSWVLFFFSFFFWLKGIFCIKVTCENQIKNNRVKKNVKSSSLSASTKIEELTAGSDEKHSAAPPGIEPRVFHLIRLSVLLSLSELKEKRVWLGMTPTRASLRKKNVFASVELSDRAHGLQTNAPTLLPIEMSYQLQDPTTIQTAGCLPASNADIIYL